MWFDFYLAYFDALNRKKHTEIGAFKRFFLNCKFVEKYEGK